MKVRIGFESVKSIAKLLQIPDNLSFEEAATMNTGVITVGQALYQSLGLPLPGTKSYGGYLLIYGGSTATGTIAIQYAVL